MNRQTRFLIVSMSALAAQAAWAGTVQVSVQDRDGKPVPDVVVLVEPAARGAQTTSTATLVIEQRDLKFAPFLSVVPVGATVRFTNRDGYDHHVRSGPSGPLGSIPAVKNFELRLDAAEAPAGAKDVAKDTARRKTGMSSADVRMDAAGPIALGCHLHSSMRGQLYVADTPWHAKTDASGVATIDGVPDGPAEARLWHPDQLQDQAPVKLQVTTAPLTVPASLNFVPRTRRR